MIKAELRIELTENDLKSLKLKEIETGFHYQNIVSALIHKYLEDKIDLSDAYVKNGNLISQNRLDKEDLQWLPKTLFELIKK